MLVLTNTDLTQYELISQNSAIVKNNVKTFSQFAIFCFQLGVFKDGEFAFIDSQNQLKLFRTCTQQPQRFQLKPPAQQAQSKSQLQVSMQVKPGQLQVQITGDQFFVSYPEELCLETPARTNQNILWGSGQMSCVFRPNQLFVHSKSLEIHVNSPGKMQKTLILPPFGFFTPLQKEKAPYMKIQVDENVKQLLDMEMWFGHEFISVKSNVVLTNTVAGLEYIALQFQQILFKIQQIQEFLKTQAIKEFQFNPQMFQQKLKQWQKICRTERNSKWDCEYLLKELEFYCLQQKIDFTAKKGELLKGIALMASGLEGAAGLGMGVIGIALKE